jgi:hypothetical protein
VRASEAGTQRRSDGATERRSDGATERRRGEGQRHVVIEPYPLLLAPILFEKVWGGIGWRGMGSACRRGS